MGNPSFETQKSTCPACSVCALCLLDGPIPDTEVTAAVNVFNIWG
ncbi:subtilosin A family bacteriocin [Paenibacillus sp. FSL H7-0350]